MAALRKFLGSLPQKRAGLKCEFAIEISRKDIKPKMRAVIIPSLLTVGKTAACVKLNFAASVLLTLIVGGAAFGGAAGRQKSAARHLSPVAAVNRQAEVENYLELVEIIAAAEAGILDTESSARAESEIAENLKSEVKKTAEPAAEFREISEAKNSPFAAISSAPQIINSTNRKPAYPESARKRGQQGTVLLRLAIDRHGKVAAVEIARSSGFSALDQSAAKAAKNWLYQPATHNGEPVNGELLTPVEFQLR